MSFASDRISTLRMTTTPCSRRIFKQAAHRRARITLRFLGSTALKINIHNKTAVAELLCMLLNLENWREGEKGEDMARVAMGCRCGDDGFFSPPDRALGGRLIPRRGRRYKTSAEKRALPLPPSGRCCGESSPKRPFVSSRYPARIRLRCCCCSRPLAGGPPFSPDSQCSRCAALPSA